MNVQVKICGIRRLDSAKAAIMAGADFMGFNFVKNSRRYIDPRVALAIRQQISGKIQVVGVFQDEDPATVNAIADLLSLDLVQLHGVEDQDYLQKINFPIIKRIDIQPLQKTMSSNFVLVDRVVRGEGNPVNFMQAKEVAEKFPIFLAGGLTPENVADAIRFVRPFAVDVASGIETNEQEDPAKIKNFVQNAKSALFGKF